MRTERGSGDFSVEVIARFTRMVAKAALLLDDSQCQPVALASERKAAQHFRES